MADEERFGILERIPEHAEYVLELGTLDGVTVGWWARQRPKTHFVSVDAFIGGVATGPGCQENWYANASANQSLFVGTIDEYESYRDGAPGFGFILLDGDHGKAETITALDCARRMVTPSGIIALHDCQRPTESKFAGVRLALDAFFAAYPEWEEYAELRTTVFVRRKV
jgi:predicted O-methyltransferase YrrM